jgi:tripartite-type tricarboxylate transporter receptor subunit TctC
MPVFTGTTMLMAVALAPATAWAAEVYPARTIRLVVPLPPGGGNDAPGRIVVDRLGSALGQRVIVDNYDPRRDLTPLGLIGRVPLVMVVHTQAPMKTMKHVIDLARISPGTLNYGSGGAGSGSHLSAELFAFMSGTKLTHVPYKGTAQAVTNLLAKEIDMVFSAVPLVRGHVEAGRLRALAITSPERMPTLPGVPTVAEAWLPGFEAVLNYGLVGPAGMPADVVKRLNTQLNKLLQAEDVKKLLATDGMTPLAGTPEQHRAVIAGDYEKWGEVVRRAGIKVD